MDQRRQYPNRAINAYDEYMTVSKIVRLPDVQGPGDIDRRAIEALGKLAEESHFKRLKSVAAGLAAECGKFEQLVGAQLRGHCAIHYAQNCRTPQAIWATGG